jgi:glycerol-3-phosphate dehydrogenase
MEKTQVVIIGGGVTGAGLLWDLSLRGISAVLLEKKDLANGATGRCHGLLHSGGRYVVKDAEAAKECISENMILKKVAAPCIHDTGGMFAHLSDDDPQYVATWADGCRKIGIPIEELSRDDAMKLEPNLPSSLVKAYTIPDGHVDVFLLTTLNVEAAVAKGARFRTYAEVTAIEVQEQKVQGVRFRDTLTGEEDFVPCEIVVNAAGGWAQQVAALAGVEVPVRCDRGALLIFNHCVVNRVVNRLRKPGDADILVPCGPVCILGTSSITVPSPENLTVTPEEIQKLLGLGIELIPALAEARLLRIFTGARPLYVPKSVAGAAGREVSRNFALLDHESTEGIGGFISIVGGKLTTYRLMGKATADLICKKLGVSGGLHHRHHAAARSCSDRCRSRCGEVAPRGRRRKGAPPFGSPALPGGSCHPFQPRAGRACLRMRAGDTRRTEHRAWRVLHGSCADPRRCRTPHPTGLWPVPGNLLRLQSDVGRLSEQ